MGAETDVITDCLPMVRSMARWLMCAKALPASIEIDDLVSAGTVGLVRAAKRYDQTRNATLKTFAEHRVRGAMLDYVREHAPLSRAHFKEATAGGVAGAFQCALDDIQEPAAPVIDLNARIIGPRLMTALRRLSTRDRYIVYQYFFEDRTLREIGVDLGISESRCHQLLSRALFTLRAAMTGPPPAVVTVQSRPTAKPVAKPEPTPKPVVVRTAKHEAECRETYHADPVRVLRAKHFTTHEWKASTLPRGTHFGEPVK